jgi:hypothetical protein
MSKSRTHAAVTPTPPTATSSSSTVGSTLTGFASGLAGGALGSTFASGFGHRSHTLHDESEE